MINVTIFKHFVAVYYQLSNFNKIVNTFHSNFHTPDGIASMTPVKSKSWLGNKTCTFM